METAAVGRVASSSSLKDMGADSDPDNRERPVREKLQKTSIDALPVEQPAADLKMSEHDDKDPAAPGEGSDPSGSDSASRGRVRRKRSFEDMETPIGDGGHASKPDRHARKKSRDLGALRPDTSSETRHKPSESIAEETHDRGEGTAAESIEPNGAVKGPTGTTAAQGLNGESKRPATPLQDIDSKESIVSPKNKRNRDQFLRDGGDGDDASEEDDSLIGSTKDDAGELPKAQVAEEPKPKRQRDSGSPQPPKDGEAAAVKNTIGSGFRDTSTTSPFSALAGNKSSSLQPQTSTAAFAASGFGALASSSSSPFGALGAAKPASSPFGALAEKKPPTLAPTAISASPFGSLLGVAAAGDKSPFGAAAPASTFGSLGAGFGSIGGGARLTSFAGGSGPSITKLEGKAAKPFGATNEDDDEEEGSSGDENEPDAQSPGEDKRDPRFHEQEISTGEEGEDEIFKCRSKLYMFEKASTDSTKSEWKERGVGDLKLLVTKPDPETPEQPLKGRFVMRADKSHRLLLNSAIMKNGKYGNESGDAPTNGRLLFMGRMEEGESVEFLQLKMKPANAMEMWKRLGEVREDM